MFASLYALRRHYLGSLALLHWLSALLMLGGVWIAWGMRNTHPAWGLPLFAAALLLPTLDILGARRDYIRFTPENGSSTSRRLAPREEIPVQVTGLFAVEGRFRRHTALDATYRTFPTREHAVIACRQPTRLLGIAHSQSRDDCMWYIFCMPKDVLRVETGRVQFGRREIPAVALTCTMEAPVRFRRGRTHPRRETIVFGCKSKSDARRVAGDLQAD